MFALKQKKNFKWKKFWLLSEHLSKLDNDP